MRLRGWYGRNERLVLGLVGFLVVGLAWELSVQAGLLKRTFVSSPSAIGQAFWFEAQAGTLWGHVGVSLTEFGLGFGVAAIVGVAIGLVGGWFRRASYIVEPWLAALYATPEIALVPLIILVLGIDLQARVFIVFLTAVFSVAVNTLVGVQSTDVRFLDVAHSFGAGRIRLFASVVLPSTVPFILSGLRIAAGRALVGVVVAELLASNQGLGYLINLAGATLNTGRMMVGVILLGLFGVAIGEALRRIENRFDVWRPVAH